MPDANLKPSVTDDERDRRVGELLNDYLDCVERGQAIPEDQFLARHPHLAAELGEHLKLLRSIEPGEAAIDNLLRAGVLTASADPRYLAELGTYKILGFLGCGGMGIVIKAYEETLNRTVALKLLRPALAQERTARQRFVREARAAAALTHPNIITIHAVGEERGTSFFSMECFEGSTLADLLWRRGPLEPDLCRRVFRALLTGLEAAHSAGLVHRDIKPSNILVGMRELDGAESRGGLPKPDTDLTVKIADFGLARLLSSQTRVTMPNSLLGTPEYMSPEQARGGADVDHRSDLYSAGVVLYEMLVGSTPFRAESPSAVVHKILHDDPPHPRVVDRAADPTMSSLALRLMAKRREERFESASDVLRAFDDGKAVKDIARRRRNLQRLIGTSLVLVLACGTAWTALWIAHSSSLPKSAGDPLLSYVKLDPEFPWRILALRDGESTPFELHAFAESLDYVVPPKLVSLPENGQQIVVAGVTPAFAGSCLFAFLSNGEQRWAVDLSDNFRWPDCGPPAKWHCLDLEEIRLPRYPALQIVAVATEKHEYPSLVAIVDPANGEVRARFWHMGSVNHVLVVDDFFAPGRPAIVAWGYNNKLDGFDDGLRGQEVQLARWDIVPVMMILDPDALDGVGPPATNRLAHGPPAIPYAYAFLDLPYERDISMVRQFTDGRPPRKDSLASTLTRKEIGNITSVQLADSVETSADVKFDVHIGASDEDGNTDGRAILSVDRDLNIVDMRSVNVSGHTTPESIEYWKKYWINVTQNGAYVSK